MVEDGQRGAGSNARGRGTRGFRRGGGNVGRVGLSAGWDGQRPPGQADCVWAEAVAVLQAMEATSSTPAAFTLQPRINRQATAAKASKARAMSMGRDFRGWK